MTSVIKTKKQNAQKSVSSKENLNFKTIKMVRKNNNKLILKAQQRFRSEKHVFTKENY